MKPLFLFIINKMKNRTLYLGLICVAFLALIAEKISQTTFALQLHLSALIIAILLGMIFGNSVYKGYEKHLEKGILFAKGQILRIWIVLYGFRLTLHDIAEVGMSAILMDALMLLSTFFLTCFIGIRYLKMDKQLVYLTASGCSICGAAAVMAAAPVTKAESHKVSVAIAVVVIFGTLSIFLYPSLYSWVGVLITPHQFGIYVGSSVHEVAQVYAIGGNISPVVANTAVITKMIRVMMLAPFLLGLSWLLNKDSQGGEQRKITIPWFALWFIAVAVFNSFNLLPDFLVKLLVELDSFLLVTAMAALGLTTHLGAIKQAGLKPLILGTLIYIWLIVGGFFLNYEAALFFSL